jgi:hypothetical protein
MTAPITAWLILTLYAAAGITTALAVKEVHHQVCTPHSFWSYVATGVAWPVAGVAMVFAGHAQSRCEAMK